MKQVLIKILKVVFLISLVLLVVLLSFGLVLSLDWPWWVGVFILLGFVGLYVAFLFFRKLWLRRREQQFVHQIIEQDESQLRQLAEKDRIQGKELQDRWKEAIEALKRSHLKKQGNPLYVLPWYLVIGESGCGKTTSIQSARLSSPFSEVARISGISGTRSCDWWFFDQAIVLDTAGRYTIRVDEERDKEEWQRFLTLLAKYRQREPLNGLIVSVAADKLLQATPEVLEEDARNIRRRIDELMRVLGAKFPVYLMVNKCDLIQGMNEFAGQLPEKALDQAMGHLNHRISTDIEGFLEESFGRIGERLRDLRLLMLHQLESRKVDPPLLLFPEEFEKLKPGLRAFMKTAFQENPFQETPIFRGIFFSSGRQEGTPYSHFLQALGLIDEKEVLPGTNKGLFLHDFFSKILPRDRGLFAPTKRSMEWARVTRNLGLTAWIALGLAVCGLLSFAFVKNLRGLRMATHEFTERAQFRGDLLTDMGTLDRFRQAILLVEEHNRGWWIPRFALNQSIEAEIRLKDFYCKQFKTAFLNVFDEQLTARMANFPPAVPDDILGRHVAHLARRINLLKVRLAGQGLDQLQARPQPAYDPALSFVEKGKSVPQKDLFGLLYLYYLIWRSDTSELKAEVATLQRWLEQMLALKNWQLNWMAGWANVQPGLEPVNLDQFWSGSLTLPTPVRVEPAFTRKGKQFIDGFMAEVESALPSPQALTRSRADFGNWYPQEFQKSWHAFLSAFPTGVQKLSGREEWRQAAAKMASDDGPYFAVLGRSASELQSIGLDKDLPGWMKLIFQFQLARSQSGLQETAQERGLLGKAAEKGKQWVDEIGKTLGSVPGVSLEAHNRAVQASQEYQKALAAITPVSASPKLAYDITSQVFSQDEVTGQSPYFTASRAATTLQGAMSAGAPAEEVFWKLVRGPLDFLWTFMRLETACYVQKRWEEEVLAETLVSQDAMVIQTRLLGENGFVWKFVRGTSAPFLGRNVQLGGYYAKDVRGDTLPFDPAFISYLNKGATIPTALAAQQAAAAQAAAQAAAAAGAPKQQYTVTVRGLPTDVNPDAKLKPQAVRLELRCDAGVQRLDNFMYPNSATFKWSPETCQDVVMRIEIGDLVLTRHYDGDMAFPKFLREFRSGQSTYTPRSFPASRAGLDELGIRYITVKYEFGGAGPVIDLLSKPDKGPPQPPPIPVLRAPSRILKCWDR